MPSDDQLMEQALKAVAAGAGKPPRISANGAAPPIASIPEPAAPQEAPAPAPAEAAQAPPKPRPASPAMDQPDKGGQLLAMPAIEAQLAQLQDDVKAARRTAQLCTGMCLVLALLLLYKNAPDAIGRRLPKPTRVVE